MKFRVVVADPCWSFSDKLTMSDVKRGAESQYKVMSNKDIAELDVESIVHDDAVLALWVPSSMLTEGIAVMRAWGFEPKQTHIWVKTKKEVLSGLVKKAVSIIEILRTSRGDQNSRKILSFLNDLAKHDPKDDLAFGMGRLFRQTHEIVLIGTRGKIYKYLKDKSQRSVHFHPVTKHSEKPEALQDMLDKMFGNKAKKLELFARRDRPGWTCVGLECPSSMGEDIHDSIKRLSAG
jgi:N6-adenosine-specific RNA methylase IME4